MPRQRTHHSRINYKFPDDFPQRPERFREASGMTWAELSRRLGAHPHTVRRWGNDGVRPGTKHMMALLEPAASLGLDHLLTPGGKSAVCGHRNSRPEPGKPCAPKHQPGGLQP